MVELELSKIVESVRRALPEAEPFAAIPLFLAQVRFLDADAGCALVAKIAGSAHPTTWSFDDARLESWPARVVAVALAAVRALPPGEDRIEALCSIPRRLTVEEQGEVLEGILDGTYPQTTWRYAKPTSRIDKIAGFVRTLPERERERWVRSSVEASMPILSELLARREVGALTERALRELWSRVPTPPPGEVPRAYQGLLEHLPADLRQEALRTVRACTQQSTRLLHLAAFDDELTEQERREVVEVPWNHYTREDPRAQADHLRSVQRHLGKVAPEVRSRWLARVLAYDEASLRQLGVLRLLPWLTGEERSAAESALLATVQEEGYFHDAPRWDLVPDAALDGLLLRLREDLYGWHRDGLVAHVLAERPASTVERLVALLLEGLDERAPDARLELLLSLAPWLAERTHGALPGALAALPVPSSEAAPEAAYRIQRALDALWREGQ